MRGITHLSVGLAGAILMGVPPANLTQAAAVAVGSFLPDIDKPGSTITRTAIPVFGAWRPGLLLAGVLIAIAGYIFLPLRVIMVPGIIIVAVGLLPHRGVTHSLIGAAAASLAAYYVAGVSYAYLFAIGYFLHLAADSLSGSVPLFWPHGYRLSLLGHNAGRVIDLICLVAGWAVVIIWLTRRF